jgi:REP element-mobilizing transposase RayT
MARPLRIEYAGAVYHITSRGNARRKIYRDDKDKEIFLAVLTSVTKRFNWLCHAYCLMDNHYHLLIETPDANLSRGMRQLNGVYTQNYNRRHNRTGHVFQGRYKAILVEKESYLLELCRYVVLNPVRAKIAEKPRDWRWSSYAGTAGIRKAPECLTTDWILGEFGSTRKRAIENYKAFVKAGEKEQSPFRELEGQILLGEEGFIETFRSLLREKEDIEEIPKSQRYAGRPGIPELFEKTIDKEERDKVIYTAHVKYGYTYKEIAEYLGLHYTTISKVIRRWEE